MNDEEIYDPMTGMKLWPIEDFKQPEQEPVKYTGGNGTAGREADVRPTGFFFQMLEQPAGTVRSMVEGRDFSIETKLSAEEYLILKQSLDEITPPRQWVGLTDEEYMDILKKNENNGFLCFYNLVEAKLREKNGG